MEGKVRGVGADGKRSASLNCSIFMRLSHFYRMLIITIQRKKAAFRVAIQGSRLLLHAMESSISQDLVNVKNGREKELLKIVPHVSTL